MKQDLDYGDGCSSHSPLVFNLRRVREHSYANMLWTQGLDHDSTFGFGFEGGNCRMNISGNRIKAAMTFEEVACFLGRYGERHCEGGRRVVFD